MQRVDLFKVSDALELQKVLNSVIQDEDRDIVSVIPMFDRQYVVISTPTGVFQTQF